MSTDQFSASQRRTQAARSTFSTRFSTAEEKAAYYRDIGEKGNAGRVTLAPDEAAVFLHALELLRPIAAKAERKVAAAKNLGENGGDA
jgi:hypothetical protein